MSSFRFVQVANVLLGGFALAMLIHGPIRVAVAMLVLNIFIQAWSVEMLRSQQEPKA